eukprot:CAMPEP_0179028964 /NCGR_PEP_ID=MMETSP0796-20121207/9813_1 /TAXON_ID=73915 /ORGANISM="Pyrodinium bahamense, Strain pbaha01" /LENGTH=44 /DNA_ID= /DNA_START= /DNA_END= /DNA_ORIENTATION=
MREAAHSIAVLVVASAPFLNARRMTKAALLRACELMCGNRWRTR